MTKRFIVFGVACAWLFAAGIGYAGYADAGLAPENQRATLIKVDKSDRTMILYRDDKEIARYSVSLGRLAPRGHKREKGDRRTPEGPYFISERKEDSKYHLALRISYPNEEDTKNARLRGKDPGGHIMVHGATGTKPWRRGNWTAGCIAVTNAEIEEIWRLVPLKTPIQIDP